MPYSEVYNDSELVFGLPNPKFITCGQIHFLTNGLAQSPGNHAADGLKPFDSVGFDTNIIAINESLANVRFPAVLDNRVV